MSLILGDTIPRFEDEVHGHVRLELFDERQRLVERIEGENYVTPTGLAWLRRTVHNALSVNFGTGVMNADQHPYWEPFEYIRLSDGARAVDTASSWPEGTEIGWASRASYSGSDTKRGSMNQLECLQTPASTKWVFDWATTAANGTIKSIGFENSSRFQYLPYYDGVLRGSHCYDATSGKYWGWNGSQMALFDFGLGTANLPAIAPPVITNQGPTHAQAGVNAGYGGIAVSATHMWVTDYAGLNRTWVKKFARPTTTGAVTVTTITIPGATDVCGVAYDGTYIWALCYATQKVYRCDATSGAVERSFSVAVGGTQWPSVVYHPTRGTIMVCSQTYGVKEYDFDGVLLGTIPSPMTAMPQFGINDLATEIWTNGYVPNTWGTFRISPNQVGSRILLPAPATKTNLNTMKVTYTFTYT